MVVFDNGTVVTWIPDVCPGGSSPSVSYDSVNAADARDFDLTSSDYYQKLMPNVIAGIVFGVLGVLGTLFFLVFICAQCCHARRKKRQKEADAVMAQQFITAQAGFSAEAVPPAPRFRPKRANCEFWTKWFMALVGLAACGICIWGLVSSIEQTDSVISDFWDIVNNVDKNYVQRAANDVQRMDTSLANTVDGLEVVINQHSVLTTILTAAGVIDPTTADALASAAQGVAPILRNLQQNVNESVSTISTTLLGGIEDMIRDYYPPSMAFQNKWRFIPIIVLFAVAVLLCLVMIPLVWRMTWYKTTCGLMALLWLDVTLLMLLGVGLLNGLYVVSNDSCLYAENFAITFAERKVSDARQRELIVNGLNYYFGATNASDTDAIRLVTGIDVPTLLTQLEQIKAPLAALSTTVTASNLAASERGTIAVDAVANLSANYNETISAAMDLVNITFRSTVEPVYHQAKEFICCSIGKNSHDLWISWTVAGCLTFVFACLCSGLIVSHTFSARGQRGTTGIEALDGSASCALPPTAPSQVADFGSHQPASSAPPFYAAGHTPGTVAPT